MPLITTACARFSPPTVAPRPDFPNHDLAGHFPCVPCCEGACRAIQWPQNTGACHPACGAGTDVLSRSWVALLVGIMIAAAPFIVPGMLTDICLALPAPACAKRMRLDARLSTLSPVRRLLRRAQFFLTLAISGKIRFAPKPPRWPYWRRTQASFRRARVWRGPDGHEGRVSWG